VKTTYEAAVYYIKKLNFYLVPIPHGQKGLDTPGWNKVENSIHTIEGAEHWNKNPNDNMGLLHGPSGTMAFDVDSVEKTKLLLSMFGLDYDELLKGAPRIVGSPGHDKAIFRMPAGLTLSTKKLSWESENNTSGREVLFELRGGAVQDVLPPSIHPNTKQPYKWIINDGVTELPLVPDKLLTIWKEWDNFAPQFINACPWSTKKVSPPKKKDPNKQPIPDEDNIIEKYNRATPIDRLIEKYGYRKMPGGKYLSPYSKKGIAGVVIFKDENKLYSHHASEPFDTSRAHDAFDIFCHFEHNGNIIEGLKDAAKQLGIKTRYEKEVENGGNIFKGMNMKTNDYCTSPTDTDLNEDSEGRKKLSESSELTRLPPFPGTDHPIFKGWMDIGTQISYSRPPFHYFALMGLCTMILGKRVRVVLSGKSIYSNMFIQLLGTSSVSGKSFAIDMTTDDGRFLSSVQNKSIEGTKTVGGEIPSQNIPLCKFMVQTNKLMEPRMVQDLAKINDNMIWYFDEAQTFYAGAANNNSSILPQLCLIYDGKTVKSKLSISKKKDGDNQEYEWACEKPFGTLIFAMTDDQFDKLASSEQSEGGFLPRFMFIYEQGGEVRENVDITPKQQIKINNLIDSVQDIAMKICILKNDSISFKVCPRIEKWKVEETNKHLGVEYTERRIAIQRIFIQVYKIAMVLTILDTDFVNNVILKDKKPNGYIDPITLDLPEVWVEEAISIAEKYLLPRMICVLQKANDVNAKSDMSKIMKVVKSNGGSLERSKIGKLTHIVKKQLDDALSSLEENNELCKVRTLESGHWIERYCLEK
jgi:hypothetical protein